MRIPWNLLQNSRTWAVQPHSRILTGRIFNRTFVKHRVWWGMMAKVSMMAGAMVRARAMLYKVVAQTVLLYGSKIWVVMGEMLKVMEGFHHQVSRRISGNMDWRTDEGEWESPPVAEDLEIEGLCPTNEYIQWCQATIASHTSCHPIYELCTGVERMPGSSRFMRW